MHHSFVVVFFFSEKKVLIFDEDPLADNSHEKLSLIFSEQLKYKYFRMVAAAVITHALRGSCGLYIGSNLYWNVAY